MIALLTTLFTTCSGVATTGFDSEDGVSVVVSFVSKKTRKFYVLKNFQPPAGSSDLSFSVVIFRNLA